jgi:hypothetical protein
MLNGAILPMRNVKKTLHIVVIPEATHAIVAQQKNMTLIFWTPPCQQNRTELLSDSTLCQCSRRSQKVDK